MTSLTDLLAFVVGSTTTVPALESFCIFCGLGILVVYIYQITWFTAWLVIDQRRLLAKRNACFPCFKIRFVHYQNILSYKGGLISEGFSLQK